MGQGVSASGSRGVCFWVLGGSASGFKEEGMYTPRTDTPYADMIIEAGYWNALFISSTGNVSVSIWVIPLVTIPLLDFVMIH